METIRQLDVTENKLSVQNIIKNIELIMDTPKREDIQKFFAGELTYTQLIKNLEAYITIIKQEDEVKRKVYLSGGMGRLAMMQWDDDSYLDAPIYIKELNFLKNFCEGKIFI